MSGHAQYTVYNLLPIIMGQVKVTNLFLILSTSLISIPLPDYSFLVLRISSPSHGQADEHGETIRDLC